MQTSYADPLAAHIEPPTMTGTLAPGSSYLEWGAVLGGVVVAMAMSVVLLQFGAGVGLAMGAPTLSDGTASWNVVVAGLWVALVALSSSAAGGYLAGRMRSRWGDAAETEVECRDGIHGLATWGVSTLAVGVLMAILAALSAPRLGVIPAPDTAVQVLRIMANASVIFTFGIAAGAALGAAAAWHAATVGGHHRDNGLSMHAVVPTAFRRKSVT